MRSAGHGEAGPLRGVETSTPALVLGVHDHNGLSQVRSLGRLGAPVYITHTPGRTAATYSRYITRRFQWDIDAAGPEETVAFLTEVVGPSIGRRSVLLPSEDGSSIIISEHSERLREWFLVPEQEPSLNRSLVDKRKLHELCLKTGTPSPETVVPETVADVEAFAGTATYPVVVKAKDGWRLRGSGDVVTLIVGDAEELLGNYQRMGVGEDLNIILQEYIPGSADSVWIFHGYSNADAEPIFGMVGNKLREYPVDTGLTSFAVNRPNQAVHGAATSFVRQVGYRGIIDLDFRHDPRDGQYKPIDFNPRPGANFRLFADSAGVDVVRAAYLDLTGQGVPVGHQRVGRKWMLENWDLAASRKYIAGGRLTVRGWLRSLRGVEEVAWAATDDPVPFGMMLRDFVRVLAMWVGRRVGG
jgi:predicted ATP-grasp superfamily ATP-dependent carboligase